MPEENGEDGVDNTELKAMERDDGENTASSELNQDKDGQDQDAEVANLLGKIGTSMNIEASRNLISSLLGFKGKRRRKIVQEVAKMVCSLKMNSSEASQVAATLSNSLRNAKTSMVVLFLSEMINLLSSTNTVATIPEIIHKIYWLVSKSDGHVDCTEIDLEPMSSDEFQDYICSRLCRVTWAPALICPLTTIINDFPFTRDQLRMLIVKIHKNAKRLERTQIPAFVYQNLLMASKGQRIRILHFISELFDDAQSSLNRSEKKQMLQIQGTVLLHFDFTIKHDQQMGNCLLNLVKQNEIQMSPFCMAIVLSLGRIQRYQNKVISFLTNYIVDYYTGEEKCKNSPWLKDIVKNNGDLHAKVPRVIQRVLSNTHRGWDHIIPSLLELGMQLIDRKLKSSASNRGTSKSSGVSDNTLPNLRLEDDDRSRVPADINIIWQGAQILRKLFKYHKVVRKELLENLLFRLITGENPVAALEILNVILSQNLIAAMEFLPNIKDTLDYLGFMQPAVAVRLIQVLKPLLLTRKSLKDHVVMVLRKAMFNHELPSRLVAAKGFLSLFDQGISESFSLSQSSQSSSQSSSESSEDMQMFLQALSILRRCLTQQAAVRKEVYSGLSNLYSRKPKLQSYILDLFQAQLRKYYETDLKCERPLKIKKCLSTSGVQLEPLPELLIAIFRCLSSSHPRTKDYTPSFKMLKEWVKSILKRLVQMNIGDYELKPPASADLSEAEAEHLNLQINCLRGVVESCLDYCISKFTSSGKLCESESGFDWIAKLIKHDEDLIGLKLSKPGKKKSPKKSKHESVTPLLSQKSIAGLVGVIAVGDDSKLRQKVAGNIHLISYILGVANRYLSSSSGDGHLGDEERTERREFCFSIAANVARLFELHVKRIDDGANMGRGGVDSLALLSIKIFIGCLDILKYGSRKNKIHFLELFYRHSPVESDRNPDSVVGALSLMEVYFNKLISNAYNEEALCLLKALETISGILIEGNEQQADGKEQQGDDQDRQESDSEMHLKWLKRMCSEKEITHGKLAFALMEYLIHRAGSPKSALQNVLEASQDLLTLHGDIAEEQQPSSDVQYAFINGATVSMVLKSVMKYVDGSLVEVEWMLRYLNAVGVCIPNGEEGDEDGDLDLKIELVEHQKAFEDAVFVRLIDASAVLNIFVMSRIHGDSVQELLKVLTKMFKLVTNGCKLLTKTKKKPSSKFRKLIQVTCKQLTVKVYPFILFEQQMNGEDASDTKSKIAKESRVIPGLIFQLEQFEKCLFQLARNSKVDLTRWMKHSTARDFRILTSNLKSQDKEKAGDEGEAGGQDGGAQKKKKTKSKSNKNKKRKKKRKRDKEISQSSKSATSEMAEAKVDDGADRKEEEEEGGELVAAGEEEEEIGEEEADNGEELEERQVAPNQAMEQIEEIDRMCEEEEEEDDEDDGENNAENIPPPTSNSSRRLSGEKRQRIESDPQHRRRKKRNAFKARTFYEDECEDDGAGNEEDNEEDINEDEAIPGEDLACGGKEIEDRMLEAGEESEDINET